MPPVKKEVIVGGHYGRLTVLSEVGKNKYNIPVYRVRCSCGKVYETSKPIILKKDAKCVDCGRVCTTEANDVPEPTQELIARVTERCAPYLLEAKQIQKPVHKKHSMRDVKKHTSHFLSA